MWNITKLSMLSTMTFWTRKRGLAKLVSTRTRKKKNIRVRWNTASWLNSQLIQLPLLFAVESLYLPPDQNLRGTSAGSHDDRVPEAKRKETHSAHQHSGLALLCCRSLAVDVCQLENNEGESERGVGVKAIAHSRTIFEQIKASGMNPKSVSHFFFFFYFTSHDLFWMGISLFYYEKNVHLYSSFHTSCIVWQGFQNSYIS